MLAGNRTTRVAPNPSLIYSSSSLQLSGDGFFFVYSYSHATYVDHGSVSIPAISQPLFNHYSYAAYPDLSGNYLQFLL